MKNQPGPIDGARIAAYRCPYCGGGVMSAVNLAGIAQNPAAGKRFRLRCANPDCDSVKQKIPVGMDVEAVEDGKVRFTVPCLLCGGVHTAAVDTELLDNRDIFTLSCPNYGADICFTGDIRDVKDALARSELELLDMMSEGDAADISLTPDTSKALPDPEIAERITAGVRFLEEEDRIFCRCQSFEVGVERIEIMPEPEAIRVRCIRCGAEKVIPAVSLIAAEDFLLSDSLALELPGEEQ